MIIKSKIGHKSEFLLKSIFFGSFEKYKFLSHFLYQNSEPWQNGHIMVAWTSTIFQWKPDLSKRSDDISSYHNKFLVTEYSCFETKTKSIEMWKNLLSDCCSSCCLLLRILVVDVAVAKDSCSKCCLLLSNQKGLFWPVTLVDLMSEFWPYEYQNNSPCFTQSDLQPLKINNNKNTCISPEQIIGHPVYSQSICCF